MSQRRSFHRIIQSSVDLKRWSADVPTVEDARPTVCPCCDCAARPFGGPIAIVGHGLRDRQLRGPLEPGGEPREHTLRSRRYRCRPCRAVLTVVPRGVVRRRLFFGPAIAYALALFGLLLVAPAEIRRRVNPWRIVGPSATSGWVQLKRWARAVRAGRLFPLVRSCPPEFGARAVAERAATTLAARAPPGGGPIEAQAFFGAMQVP